MRNSRSVLATLALVLVIVISAHAVSAATIYYQATPYQGMDRWFGSYYDKPSQYDWRLRVGGWGDEYDTVLRCDQSSLPQVATKAIVWLYVFPEGYGFTALNWYQISSQWQSANINWLDTWVNLNPKTVYLGYSPAPTRVGWFGVDFTYQYNNYWRR